MRGEDLEILEDVADVHDVHVHRLIDEHHMSMHVAQDIARDLHAIGFAHALSLLGGYEDTVRHVLSVLGRRASVSRLQASAWPAIRELRGLDNKE